MRQQTQLRPYPVPGLARLVMSYPFPWGPPPPGYIPGLGRGAVGFVSSIEKAPIGLESDAVVKSKQALEKKKKEDDKADDFYRGIEARMKARRKEAKTRDASLPAEKTVFDEVRQNFSDLRHDLATVSSTEWANLPEIGATTYHRPKWELYTYASDRTITHDFDKSALNQSAVNDEDTLLAAARAQREAMDVQLSQVLPNRSYVDVPQFMQEFETSAAKMLAQYKDLDRAADLYKSMTRADKHSPQGWLMRGRIEERLGNVEEARKIIRRGLSHCPESELLVMEAARLSSRADAISLLESSVKVLHAKSEKLWLQLLAYQTDTNAKKLTLQAAMRAIPRSESLWRATAAFETREEHAMTLRRAVEVVPNSQSLWIEGIRCSLSMEDGRYFVDEGVKVLGELPDVYLAWAKLAEKFKDFEEMKRACRKVYECAPSYDFIKTARVAEEEGFGHVTRELLLYVPQTEAMVEYALAAENAELYTTAEVLFERYAEENGNYRDFLKFAKRRGNVARVMDRAVKMHPENETLVLEICRFMNRLEAIPFLEAALDRMPKSERICLMLCDMLIDISELDKAHSVVTLVLERLPHSVALALKVNELNDMEGGNLGFLHECCSRMPWVADFWVFRARHAPVEERIELLVNGLKHCQASAAIHIALISSAMETHLPRPRIRALFERARNKCPADVSIWLYWSEFEPEQNRVSILEEAKTFAKQDLGLIWARQIEQYDPEMRYKLAIEALPVTDNAKELSLLLAISLWKSGAVDKARAAFENINRDNPTWGDGWIFRLRFEQSFGPEDSLSSLYHHVDSLRFDSGFVWLTSRRKLDNIGLTQMALLQGLVDTVPDPFSADCSLFLTSLHFT